MAATRTPVMFIHGLWLHASSWGNWVNMFHEAGYAPMAPDWPGHPSTAEEARRYPESIAGKGINDATNHYAAIIESLAASPIVIGHSFGGLVAQKLLDQGLASAAVAIDSAQIKGVWALPATQLRAMAPVLRNPININRAVMLTEEEFRYNFGNAISPRESLDLYQRWAIPAPGKPVFSAAVANLNPKSPARVNTANPMRGPLLLIAGGQDNTIPPEITHSTYRLYSQSPAVTELREFPDRGHSLIIDSRWKEVAYFALAWLKQQALGRNGSYI